MIKTTLPSKQLLGCTHLFFKGHGLPKKTILLNSMTKRMLTQKSTFFYVRQRPPLMNRMALLGSVRYHGSHHHHHDADLMTSLKTSSKRGTRITVIGLASNVGLTVTKGIAGWVMNSASLLAEAFHSFSDLLSDFVTLYTFKMSRKPADSIYPYGYGKFETVGSVTVSSLLLAGAIGIGWHSFDLLLATLPFISDTAATVTTVANEAASHVHHHHHHHGGGVLDPNAAWFALASVIIKEWLYRATIKVGIAEHSDVLMANAWHHRSDAYSSAVALVAIVGSYAGLPVLDPLGGIVVSGMLIKSSVSLLGSSVKELMDKGITAEQLLSIETAIAKVKKEEINLLSFHSVRGRKLGRFNHIDLVLQLNPNISVKEAYKIEEHVRSTIKHECENIQDISIHVQDPSFVKEEQHNHGEHNIHEEHKH
ncbi:cation efflux family-domain-containing protein [Cokeromyces recurvatus]|uniref:cation efflux family-domain-containing protein n=1 Tax=Cokeromyces recurvatus TaxID=90255 RepID=UPI0022211114|nr:cation efflux family-domain-containing protein [Cokeromyces recurvatus]KAI7906185.1 cation efflux family-domain-containing protein [Cokeromyces recurvatus]